MVKLVSARTPWIEAERVGVVAGLGISGVHAEIGGKLAGGALIGSVNMPVRLMPTCQTGSLTICSAAVINEVSPETLKMITFPGPLGATYVIPPYMSVLTCCTTKLFSSPGTPCW